MSIAIYTDQHTHELLDQALEDLADIRGVNLATGPGLLGPLASLARQLDEMIEYAIAESDIGHEITLDDIAQIRPHTDPRCYAQTGHDR